MMKVIFSCHYRIRKELDTLKSALTWADYVYVTPDSNITGEFLSLQVQNLTLECNEKAKIYRLHIKELTVHGLQWALDNLKSIDEDLAYAEKLRVEVKSRN